MRITTNSLAALTVAVSLLAAACTDAETTESSGDTTVTTAPSEPIESPANGSDQDAADSADGDADDKAGDGNGDSNSDDAENQGAGDGTADIDVQDVVRRIGDGHARVAGDWPGFDPNDHPTILALKAKNGDLLGAIAFNFPQPDTLGQARELDVAGTPIKSAHHITDLKEADKLSKLSGFDFHFKIGGVDSFAMEAGGPDEFFNPGTDDYVGTFMHELFHRWQDEGFVNDISSQDVEGYAYTTENLTMAALEDRALIELFNAKTDDAREQAARRFAAVRMARMAADPRVAALDNSQERFEGTARYIEHRLGGDDTGFGYFNETDYTAELITDPTQAQGVKDHYGFGRFYGTGAAILGALDALGAEGVDDKIESGLSPAELLIEFLGVSDADVDALVAEAKAGYDPLGELDELAAQAAETARTEPAVFGENDGGAGPDGAGAPADGQIVIGNDEIECLSDRGVDLVAGDEPSQEDFEACIGG